VIMTLPGDLLDRILIVFGPLGLVFLIIWAWLLIMGWRARRHEDQRTRWEMNRHD